MVALRENRNLETLLRSSNSVDPLIHFNAWTHVTHSAGAVEYTVYNSEEK